MPTSRKPRSLQGRPDAGADLLFARRQLGRLGAAADMHVGAAVVLGRHTVDGADRFAVDQDDALVALADVGQILLGDEGLAEHLAEHFQQRGQVAVVAGRMEHAGAAIAVERLQDDVAHLVAEAADFGRHRG